MNFWAVEGNIGKVRRKRGENDINKAMHEIINHLKK